MKAHQDESSGLKKLLILLVVCIFCFSGCQPRVSLDDDEEEKEEEIPGGDWRTWRSYSDEYVLNDDFAVLLSPLDGGTGYAVYTSDGVRISSLVLLEYTSNDIRDILIADYDGDGENDIGLVTYDGVTLWYRSDYEGEWPEDPGGPFSYLWTDIAISSSTVSYPFEPYAINNLSDVQKSLYNDMLPKIQDMEDFSFVAAVVGYDTLDNALAAWSALKLDYPEINNYFMLMENIDNNGMTVSLDAHYRCQWYSWDDERGSDIDEIRTGLEVFESECDSIIASMPKNASTYEKYRYLAVALSNRTQYDYEFEHPGYQTPYGIITGYSICQGYSEAYQYLCSKAGLWCQIVSGASQNVSHGWNLVKLDSGTYHVDITWADEQGEPGSVLWMRYFMLTQDEILEDHEIFDNVEASGTGEF